MKFGFTFFALFFVLSSYARATGDTSQLKRPQQVAETSALRDAISLMEGKTRFPIRQIEVFVTHRESSGASPGWISFDIKTLFTLDGASRQVAVETKGITVQTDLRGINGWIISNRGFTRAID